MISHVPPAPRRNAAKIRSGTCSSDNNEEGFAVFDRRVMAGIGLYQARTFSERLPELRGAPISPHLAVQTKTASHQNQIRKATRPQQLSELCRKIARPQDPAKKSLPAMLIIHERTDSGTFHGHERRDC